MNWIKSFFIQVKCHTGEVGLNTKMYYLKKAEDKFGNKSKFLPSSSIAIKKNFFFLIKHL